MLGDVGFEEVVRNVEEVLRRGTSSAQRSDRDQSDKRLETYMGDKTAGEMMDLALGHWCIT